MIYQSFNHALVQLVGLIIDIYVLIIIIRSVLSWTGSYPINQFTIILKKMTDPLFRFVHRKVPFAIIGNVDISPIIIIIALYLINKIFQHIMLGI